MATLFGRAHEVVRKRRTGPKQKMDDDLSTEEHDATAEANRKLCVLQAENDKLRAQVSAMEELIEKYQRRIERSRDVIQIPPTPPTSGLLRLPQTHHHPPKAEGDPQKINSERPMESHPSEKGIHHRHFPLQKSKQQDMGNGITSDKKNENPVHSGPQQYQEEKEKASQQQIDRPPLSGQGKPLDPEVGSPTHEAQDDIVPLLQDSDRQDLYECEKDYSHDKNTFSRMVYDRAGWLVGLLVLQSMSSFIIQRNEVMLQKHLAIVRFLTMLVGAGGNAGNQSSVRVIRKLALGTVHDHNVRVFLMDEFAVGLCLSVVLGISGCVRAAVFLTPLAETIAITSALVLIVMISVMMGATLPLGMKLVGIDPAHSSTTIQVLMDILGVTITVVVSSAILDSPIGQLLVFGHGES